MLLQTYNIGLQLTLCLLFLCEAVYNLTVTNLTSAFIEMSWLIPSKCSDSTQKGFEINGEIQPLKYVHFT